MELVSSFVNGRISESETSSEFQPACKDKLWIYLTRFNPTLTEGGGG
jgi:hypothetical protein